MTRGEMIKNLIEYCKEHDEAGCEICALHDCVCRFDSAEDEELIQMYGIAFGEKQTIKDSGDRTEFATGAVRDMHEGKGRLDLLPCTAVLELAKHCEAGAKKYGERNVDKGIPQHSFIDSGLRHLFKYLRGDRDENHLVADLWNIAWAVEQDVTKPELNDIPSRKESET